MKKPIGAFLGLSHSRDSGVALLREGTLIAAVNEERLSRHKQDGSFPHRSLEWLLGRGGVAAKEIGAVALAGPCRQEAPACVHVDGTMRPQVIDRAANPAYYDILSEYHALTGRAVLVNPSFNIHEEPIVCSPEDALRAFESSWLDYVVLGPFLVPRFAEPTRSAPHVGHDLRHDGDQARRYARL